MWLSHVRVCHVSFHVRAKTTTGGVRAVTTVLGCEMEIYARDGEQLLHDVHCSTAQPYKQKHTIEMPGAKYLESGSIIPVHL